MRRFIPALLLCTVFIEVTLIGEEKNDSKPIHVSNSKQLLIDEMYFEESKNVSLKLRPAKKTHEQNLVRDQLWENIHYMHNELRKAGLDIAETKSQVIPIMAGNDLRLREISKRIQARGLYTGVVTYPAVSKNKTRLRLSVSSKHTKEQMDECVRIIREVFESMEDWNNTST